MSRKRTPYVKAAALHARVFAPTGHSFDTMYTPSKEDYEFMSMAFEEAVKAREEGNPPVGAVIATGVDDQTHTYRGRSDELTTKDLRRHAEMNAYDAAQPELGLDLSASSLYVTAEPCEMCGHVYTQGHIGKIVIAAMRSDAPDFFRQKRWNIDDRLQHAGRSVLVVSGFMREEALQLLTAENKRH
jgi:tRNA(adenine34) deaminase